jgi:hypothetical protein
MGNSTSVIGNESNVLAGFFKGNAEKLISATKVLTVADLDCMNVCSGTTADYSVYLPKPADCIGHYIGFRMDPGLTKLVTIDAGQTDNTKTGTVQVRTGLNLNLGNIHYPLFYSGTAVGSIDGYANLAPGDDIQWTPNGTGTTITRKLSAISSSGGTVTASWSSTGYSEWTTCYGWQYGVIGTNTTFTTDLTVGGTIWVGGESRTVTWIGDDTHCAVSNVFSTAGSGFTYSAAGTPYTIDGEQKRIMWANEVAILYSDGYKWIKIAGKSIPMTASFRLNANQTASVSTLTVIAWDCVQSSNSPAAMTASLPYITILRSGTYRTSAIIQFSDGNATKSFTLVNIGTLTQNWLWHYEYMPIANQRHTRQCSGDIKCITGDKLRACFRYDAGSFATALEGYTAQTYISNNFSVEEIISW